MRPLAPPYVAAIAPYQPGKPVEELKRELGGAWPAAGAIKLASNENPYGPSPKALAAIPAALADVSRYPDAGSFALRDRLAAHYGVERERVLVGSGSNEIINTLVQAFCGEGEEVLSPRWQFVCYRLAAEVVGRAYRECDNGDGFSLSADALLAAVRPQTKVVFLANPNNPTGAYLPKAELEKLVRELPPHIVFALDEAYVEYADAPDYADALPMLASRERFLVMRTFSKIYGLAGLRVGYAITHAPIVDLVNRVRLPFNLTSIAQAAAIAALDDTAHVELARGENRRERSRMTEELGRRGFAISPSQGNFLLVAVPAPWTAMGLYDALLRIGVIVRPLQPYRLPQHLRITVGTHAENDRLYAALDEVLGSAR